MQELNIPAGNVIKNFLSDIWLNTKGQYIRESNTFATNGATKKLQRGIWLNTKRQYMKA